MSLTVHHQPIHLFGRYSSFSPLMSSERTTASPAGSAATPKSFSFSIDSLVNGSKKRNQISAEEAVTKRPRSLSPGPLSRSPTDHSIPALAATTAGPLSVAPPPIRPLSSSSSQDFSMSDAAKHQLHQHQSRMYSHAPHHPSFPHHHSNPFLSGSAGFMRPAFDAYNPSASLYPWLLASRHPGLAGHFPGK